MTLMFVKMLPAMYFVIGTAIAEYVDHPSSYVMLSEPGSTLLQSTDSLRRNVGKVVLEEDDDEDSIKSEQADKAVEVKAAHSAVEEGAAMIQRASGNLLSGAGIMIQEEIDSLPCMNPNVDSNPDHTGEHRSVGMRSCFYETDSGF
eukprot:gnl/MRDRNA2_/MRDRNA2_98233_c0_seq1.p1 gnl/MRDRNA2_/MRDRNA2_98233_c0~~gnl/MRDRNA2_/MRDRNA2_98233_c0_seq1.p1  ORF type:complete len:146 (+),score=34.31 gnl/MRDRNA2_/MRDRNA2_98233_c0_seq1:86-523(+)